MAAYGSIARDRSSELFIRSPHPLASVSASNAPVGISTFVKYSSSFGSPSVFTTGSAITYTVIAKTIQYSRHLPWWAMDWRGFFPNSSPAVPSTSSYAMSTSYIAAGTNVLTRGMGSFKLPTVGIPVTGTMSGQVRENGGAVAGKMVGLYYRPTMQLIDRKLSDISGNFTFFGLEPLAPNNSEYFIVSLNATPLLFNAVIHDKPSAG